MGWLWTHGLAFEKSRNGIRFQNVIPLNRETPLNVLIVATKSPWPPVDGGRLLLSLTLEGLERMGCHCTLVAPEARPVSPLLAVARSWRLPLAIARHAQPAVPQERSEERRVGKECNGQCRSRWSPYH